MPRKLRIWHEGARYHITCRGNHKENIFRDTSDFNMYLSLITYALYYFNDTPYKIMSYCLMDNHVHLLIQTSTKPIGEFMKRLNMSYAIYFNKKYDYTGHLFQDRFFSDLITNHSQLLEVSKYIHLNPVRAKMVTAPEYYPWSSYGCLIGYSKLRLDFIDTHSIWLYFDKLDAPNQYKLFVEGQTLNNSNDSPLYNASL